MPREFLLTAARAYLLHMRCAGDPILLTFLPHGHRCTGLQRLTNCPVMRNLMVNLRCITAVSRMNVYVGGAALPIGRTYKDAFTEAFSRYMAKKEWEDPCQP